MGRLPAVTVAMPVHNGRRFLLQAISSILSQTYTSIELIVVDDGSTDDSADIVRSVACKDSRVIPLYQSHGGIARAMNAALRKARGRYFAPMDQDDLSHPERLAREVEFLDANPNVAVVGTGWETFESKAKRTIPPTLPHDVAKAMHQWCAVMHPSAMIRTDFLREIGGYRTALPYGHDSDLWLRVLERGEMANIPDVLLRKRVHSTQVTRSRKDAPARIAMSGIIYLSHLSRLHFGRDFVVGPETLVDDAVRFFHRFIREIDERNPAIYRHLNRFLRYVPLTIPDADNDPIALRHPYVSYFRDQIAHGEFKLAARAAYYLLAFYLFNPNVTAAGPSELIPAVANEETTPSHSLFRSTAGNES